MSEASSRREAFLAASGMKVPKSVLFHGTSAENAEAIMREGFRLDAEQRHGRASGEGVYLHHDPLVAAQHGPAMVAVKKAPGTRLSSYHDAHWDGWKPRPDHEVAEYLARHEEHGFKDPDDGSTIITDPGMLKPVATSHSGQCPSCFGNGYHPRTIQSCPTCSGKGVMW